MRRRRIILEEAGEDKECSQRKRKKAEDSPKGRMRRHIILPKVAEEGRELPHMNWKKTDNSPGALFVKVGIF